MNEQHHEIDEADRSEPDETNRGFDRRGFLKSVGVGAVGVITAGITAGTTAASSVAGSPVVDLVDGDSAAESSTHTAVSSGRWNDPATWNNGIPGDGARVTIPPGKTVTLGAETARLHWLRVDGTYRIDPATNTHLRVDTVITLRGSTFEMGTAADPVDPNVTANVTFMDRGPIDESWDPKRFSRGLVTHGNVTVHGAEKTGWGTLSSTPTAGATTLELDSAPTNWRAGDTVVVPGQQPQGEADDTRVLTNVDGSTVELDSALDHDHVPSRSGFDAYIMNLDRTVRFESEADAGDTFDLGTDDASDVVFKRRGHIMFMSGYSEPVTVKYAGMYDLGRTDKREPFTDMKVGTLPESAKPSDVNDNRRARYALHFHRTGIEDADGPHVIEGCSVAPRTGDSGTPIVGWKGSPGWGYVNHHSYTHINDNVSYDVIGAGFVTEGGNERGEFKRNMAVRSDGSGETVDHRNFLEDQTGRANIDDFGHGGHGFWMQSPALHVDDNVAAGHRSFGFAYWTRALSDRLDLTGVADGDFQEAIGQHKNNFVNFPMEYVEGMANFESYAAPGTILDSPGTAMDYGAAYPDDREGTWVKSSQLHLFSFTGNTVFGSGGALDISQHGLVQPHRHFEEYSIIDGFSAYDIADTTIDTGGNDIGNTRTTPVGVTPRYCGNVMLRDSAIYGPDDGIGTGVVHNGRTDNLAVVDTTVAGWQLGMRAERVGLYRVEGVTLDNDTNLGIKNYGGDDLPHDPQEVDLSNLTFEGDPPHIEFVSNDDHGVIRNRTFPDLATYSTVALDGRTIYSEIQAPDYVLYPDGSLDTSTGYGVTSTHEGYHPSPIPDDDQDLVGKTNQQLMDEFGVAFEGELMPSDAISTPIANGRIAPGDDSHTGGGGATDSVEAAINCGDGNAHTTSTGVTYAADAYYSGGGTDAADRDIARTDEDGLYDSNRWGNEMTYEIPVSESNATYDLTLHFAETYFSSSGARVFDALVNGNVELAEFDPYAEAGGKNTAVSRTLSGVTPHDGTITVSFHGRKDNALISGIEVVSSGSPDAAPAVSITSAPERATVGESVTFEASGNDPDGGSVSYAWSSSGGSSPGSGPSYETSFGSAGNETIEVTVTDDEGQTATASTTVSVTEDAANTGGVETAINCGETTSYTASDGVVYHADTDYDGGAMDAADRAIAGTTDDDLYDSNRWGSGMAYEIPVSDANATYDLTLHFAETYFSSSGARVFDVLVGGRVGLDAFDPYAEAGGKNTAVSRTVSGVTPTDGAVSVSFEAQVDNPLVSGIEVVQR